MTTQTYTEYQSLPVWYWLQLPSEIYLLIVCHQFPPVRCRLCDNTNIHTQGARPCQSGSGYNYPLTDFPIILSPIPTGPVLVMLDKTNIDQVPEPVGVVTATLTPSEIFPIILSPIPTGLVLVMLDNMSTYTGCQTLLVGYWLQLPCHRKKFSCYFVINSHWSSTGHVTTHKIHRVPQFSLAQKTNLLVQFTIFLLFYHLSPVSYQSCDKTQSYMGSRAYQSVTVLATVSLYIARILSLCQPLVWCWLCDKTHKHT